jgi:hypothetical protein
MSDILTYGQWYPAAVLVVDTGQVWHRCRVYVTSAGLRVFRTKPESGDSPDWESPLDMARHAETGEPNWTANQIGVDIHTEAGTVVITPTGGCGCGSTLKRWVPRWANRAAAWPTATPVS